ncbi:MAG: pyridoxal 5'-phosphate synthase glutaminase subunit PdxT [Thermoleophilia bacterium]
MSIEIAGAPARGRWRSRGPSPNTRPVLQAAGADAVQVRTPQELAGLTGLVRDPGGESTTIRIVAGDSGLLGAVRAAVDDDLPVLGYLRGAHRAGRLHRGRGHSKLVGGLDVVRRNAYGRQVASFETALRVPGLGEGDMDAVFIRAPQIVQTGPAVRIIAVLDGQPVAVRQGEMMGVAFHPELTDDRRFHAWLVDRARHRAAGRATNTREDRRVGAQ